jgi:hypothetical protein
VTDEVADAVLDRLIQALAQLDTSAQRVLTPGAIDALVGLSRAEAGLIFSRAGHLVHYGVATALLEILIQRISDVQRGEAAADAAIAPGDEVRLVGEPPDSLAVDYDRTWLREAVFIVRYVGDDATVDLQPDLTEDYLIETVPIALVKPTQRQRRPPN